MKRLKKGDQVMVMTGKEKGKQGKIKQIIVDKQRAVVEGVNSCRVYKKNRGAVDMERPIHLSNLALMSGGRKSEPMKVSYIVKDGKKEKVNRKSNKE
ncbi:50S ribosomal protein L24 [Mycoplasma suis]|uniref:Large ribosomal subunit protein uL24 n=2 Tax=Mycoplasma suis TaxID=57372 RepID=F0QR46_MYCSL|nr:50S ribosomal protein L24 [Mycoplasma suis]ADX97966.1 50S ribosomal protein L24 [Mycoplasma suis str. Illinois]CBZ40463.1 50S ribosomal protein L24 [Mycoplasma suis KI3806]